MILPISSIFCRCISSLAQPALGAMLCMLTGCEGRSPQTAVLPECAKAQADMHDPLWQLHTTVLVPAQCFFCFTLFHDVATSWPAAQQRLHITGQSGF